MLAGIALESHGKNQFHRFLQGLMVTMYDPGSTDKLVLPLRINPTDLQYHLKTFQCLYRNSGAAKLFLSVIYVNWLSVLF